jgi:hypothetical protein
VENFALAKLVEINSPYFDYDACNFTEKNMYCKDKSGISKEGSGRVAIHKATGIVRCYTLECNYNIGRTVNHVAAGFNIDDPEVYFEKSPFYSIETYQDLGKAMMISVLDSIDANPYSRLRKSAYQNFHGVKVAVAQ